MTENAHTAPTASPHSTDAHAEASATPRTADAHTAGDAPRRFRRDRGDAMLAGVCSGAANLLGIDATIVRVLLVVGTLLGFGAGILLYLACWIIVPEQR
ncbi:hypothetical protein GCM10027174_05370 [Salinifilum aidingensis]